MAIRHTLSAAALMICMGSTLAQAPANDDCSTAAMVVVGLTPFDSTLATDGAGLALDPMVCDMGSLGDEQIYQDVWFQFSPPATATYDVASINNGGLPFDSRLAVYNQSTCPDSPANVIACDDDSGVSQQASVSGVLLNSGQTYLVRVGSFASFTTEFPAELRIGATPPPPSPPSNDDCSNASAIGLGLTSFTTVGATNGTGLALNPAVCSLGGDEQIYDDVWFSLVVGASGNYTLASVNNGNTPFDSRIAVYDQSSCPDDPANVIACDDDSGPGNEARINSVSLVAGTTYLVRVGSFGDATVARPAALSIFATPSSPSNDDCASPATAGVGLLPYDSSFATDGTGLALDPGVCSLGGDEQIYQDLWFSFTPGGSGYYDIASVNNGNATFDTRLAVYDQSSCPDDPANVIACDDDSGPIGEALVSSVLLSGGSTYLIRVGSFSPFTVEQPAALSISLGTPPPSPPANDDCGTAQVTGSGLTPFNLSGATDGSGQALDAMVCDMGTFGDEQLYADVWFSFTAGSTGNFDIAAVANGNPTFDSRIAVYNQASCPDNPANVIACDDDSGGSFQASAENVPLTGGSTYLIRVGTFSPAEMGGPGALEIEAGNPVANDDCEDAQVINSFGTYAFDNTLATTDGLDLNGFCPFEFGSTQIFDDVWFEYTPTVGGCTYISTLGLVSFDSRLAVYATSSCPEDPSTVVACSDDEVQPIASPYEAGMDVDLVAGTTYLIRLGNFTAGAGGAGSLQIAAGPVAVNSDGGAQVGAPGCAAPTFPDLCNGDGGNQMGCTNCPCMNNSAPGTIGGCMNSAGTSSRLSASGDTSLALPAGATTDLRFTASGMPPTAFGVLISGNAVAPGNMANPCFGQNSGVQFSQFDGLRCAVQMTQRHGGRSADAMGVVDASTGPSRVWGGEAQPNAGIGVQGGFTAGQTRFFQINHREDALLGCMRGLNNSQAVGVTFTP